MLAAERTWLAWWRSGIAAATAAVAVGGVVPELVGGSRTPYVLLGAGYALLSAAVMIGGWRRHRGVQDALARGTLRGRVRPMDRAGSRSPARCSRSARSR